jgi:uncharacterized membrane protein
VVIVFFPFIMAAREHESRYRKTASILLLVLQYWISAFLSWLGVRPLLPPAIQQPPVGLAIVPGLIAVTATVILFWLGQGGSRNLPARRPDPDTSNAIGDRTEDRLWRLGIFYFNRDDPSVLVEKRFGIGYTLNFARPVAWLILLLPVLTLISVTTVIAARHMTR